MERPHQQQSLFRTGKKREAKVRQIDRQNQQAARIILEQHPGGLMEEWARQILAKELSRSAIPPENLVTPYKDFHGIRHQFGPAS
jgi:hypothetical protein